jgi:hypothetical protein
MASASDFDFWLGEWKVAWGDGEKHGRNVITRSHDGHVVEERFDGRPGVELRGTSVNVFDEHRDRWLQTWVDDAGNYFALEGGIVDGEMVLLCDRHNNEQRDAVYRMRFFDIQADSLTWTWEKSLDGGDSFEVLWRLDYSRAPSPRPRVETGTASAAHT